MGPAMRSASSGRRTRIVMPATSGASTEVTISSVMCQALTTY